MTDQERALARAKKPKVSPWRAWHGTSEQLKREKERQQVIVPSHTKLVR